MKSDAERQEKSRQKRKQQGCRQISLMLSKAAADILVEWTNSGWTIAEVVNQLLSESKPKKSRK